MLSEYCGICKNRCIAYVTIVGDIDLCQECARDVSNNKHCKGDGKCFHENYCDEYVKLPCLHNCSLVKCENCGNEKPEYLRCICVDISDEPGIDEN